MTNLHSLMSENSPLFLTDAGLETWLVFHRAVELREFAAFELINSKEGKTLLSEYFNEFLSLAQTQSCGFIMDTPTWRANPDWCHKLGYSDAELERINQRAVEFMQLIRAQHGMEDGVLINGVIGPRGDGYVVDSRMSATEAQEYHCGQIRSLIGARVDLISALTLTYVEEAIGIVNAVSGHSTPVVVSFTVETDGRLPSGQSLGDAIKEVDAATDSAALYYMINCAHPDHFRDAINHNENWIKRIGAVRANASRMSHAELDAAPELDEGNPIEFGELYRELRTLLPNLRALGGCCGTDIRHVTCVANCALH